MSISQPDAENITERNSRDTLENDLEIQLRFQRKWRVISMTGYVITTVGTLLCSAGATYFAASNIPNIAAILAGIATVLVGTEKSLLFREKWKFHLLMYTKLNVLRANIRLARLNTIDASSEFASIMTEYAAELPMAAREQS